MARWTDIHELLVDVRSHVKGTGRPVVLADDPMRRDLGYRDGDATWVINLNDAKKSLAARPDENISTGMRSLAGRLALANS